MKTPPRSQSGDQSTRRQIIEILNRQGKATVEELARALGVTLMAVRLHLASLERDGLVSRKSLRKGPGRPAFVFWLTDKALDELPKRYHTLADKLLEGMEDHLTEEQLELVCGAVATSLASTHSGRMIGLPLADKVAEASRILNESGCAADWESTSEGFAIHEHNCPYYRVAQKHPQLCRMDQAFMSDLLDAEVEMSGRLVDQGQYCTYVIRPRESERYAR
jgi:DeoR family transcriptional regulator, suf operon transcriptional repressor